MAEYIKREALSAETKSVIREYLEENTFSTNFAAGVLAEFRQNVIDEIPAADVVEVKHGRWIDRPRHEGWEDEDIINIGMVNGVPWSSCYCSECGDWLVASDEYSVKGYYCPNCGTKMDLED